MKFGKANLALIGAALLSLGACDKLELPGGDVTSSDSSASKKLDGYTEGHNTLLDSSFGFEKKTGEYIQDDVAHHSLEGYFHADPGWIGKGVAALKEARALPGGSAELDKAADALIASMGKVETHMASLDEYYTSKKYLDDKLARGKAEDPVMLAEIDAAGKDLVAFSKLLDTALDQRDVVLLEKLKDADPVKYQTKLALIHSKKLIEIFNGEKDPTKPELIAKGDAEIVIIEKAVADARAEATKAGRQEPNAASTLVQMIGEYRGFKQSRDPRDLDTVLTYYNQSVDLTNHAPDGR
ncbi:DUF3829 domain-containing protein [Sphingomonas immobilis]|uniref:DUF3829 domain-containing protein n=1 Tax=Sphingomonas immobilis TaxID=3063997 RepID=A0ABT8ZZX1_9SPHN|nr:DUF3829 domain-containing protein [Sphingomonas sp. CA1-15]MDO7842555.1 DUF3829 domain-containing protein [Sphingomonas sp. CA1-15]